MSNAKIEPLVDSEFDADESNDSAGEMTWPKPVFSQEMLQAHAKGKKKRVHSNSFSHSGTNGLSVNGVSSDRDSLVHAMQKVKVTSSRAPFSKNSKKSRNGFKHSPNKRGGKHLPRPIEDMDEIELDKNDPDYDSDENDPVFHEEVIPPLLDEIFEERLNSLLREYFSHSETSEFIQELLKLYPSSAQLRKLPYLCINLALQFKLRECEMVSTLLSDMYHDVITPPQMQQGFHLVLDTLPEIVIDVPRAPEFVGRFVARAIADEILPPCFVKTQRSSLLSEAVIQCHQGHHHNHHHYCFKDSPTTILGGHSASLDDTTAGNGVVVGEHAQCASITQVEVGGGATAVEAPARTTLRSNSGGDAYSALSGNSIKSFSNGKTRDRTGTYSSGIGSAIGDDDSTLAVVREALDRADRLLVVDHAYARLHHVWGVKVGHSANSFLVEKMKELLRELLVSDDIGEATRCLQELDSPHFHHELVYQGILLVIEKNNDITLTRVANFFDSLSRTVVLLVNQLVTGVKRIYTDMPEIQIDVPKAYTVLEEFMKHCLELGFVSKQLVDDMPSKSRRRFISEGDALHSRSKLPDV